jgi:hypothetical protein
VTVRAVSSIISGDASRRTSTGDAVVLGQPAGGLLQCLLEALSLEQRRQPLK